MNAPILTIEISSFSYKDPPPPHLFSWDEGRHGGGFVFDLRSLPNPGRDPHFKTQTGLDSEVITYLESCSEVLAFRSHAFALVVSAVENYVERQFTFLTVGFGCTGGQHRSVYFTQQLGHFLSLRFPGKLAIRIRHVRLQKDEVLP